MISFTEPIAGEAGMYKAQLIHVFTFTQIFFLAHEASAIDKSRRRPIDSSSVLLIAEHRNCMRPEHGAVTSSSVTPRAVAPGSVVMNLTASGQQMSPYDRMSVEQLRVEQKSLEDARLRKKLGPWCNESVSYACCKIKRRNACCILTAGSFLAASLAGVLSCVWGIETIEDCCAYSVPESQDVAAHFGLCAGCCAGIKATCSFLPNSAQEEKELREVEDLLRRKKNQ